MGVFCLQGLYKFALNFDLISEFMPGRSANLLRTRFQSTILPGLAYVPWKASEDGLILWNCHKKKKPIRILAKLLPSRTPYQVTVAVCDRGWSQCLHKLIYRERSNSELPHDRARA